MTSTELATTSPGRSSALKAWETRRARGFVPQTRQQKVTWPDYGVDSASWRTLQWPSPTLVVTFADGEVVRAPAVSLQRKPINIGRGLRIAIAFYQSRICRRLGLPNRLGTRPALPPIAACICEDTAEVYDADLCNARTVEDRAAQDWKMRP